MLVGGNGGASPRLADTLALHVEKHEAVQMFEKLAEYYRTPARPDAKISFAPWDGSIDGA